MYLLAKIYAISILSIFAPPLVLLLARSNSVRQSMTLFLPELELATWIILYLLHETDILSLFSKYPMDWRYLEIYDDTEDPCGMNISGTNTSKQKGVAVFYSLYFLYKYFRTNVLQRHLP